MKSRNGFLSILFALSLVLGVIVFSGNLVQAVRLESPIYTNDETLIALDNGANSLGNDLVNKQVKEIKESNPNISDSNITSKVLTRPIYNSKQRNGIPVGMIVLALTGYRKDNSTYNVDYAVSNTVGVDGTIYCDFTGVTADGTYTRSWIWHKATSGGGYAAGNHDLDFAPAEWNYAGLTFGYMDVPYPYESPASITPGGINFK
ncbi:hypothetical protein [Companilactobacillus sp.]|uniref:hypothetical protein n=1 Tax=Companilactobacillus sp. TaxID=2767905 RepID=UPI002603EA33|nr:hypothetical protein [Companilactobacillus sp.]